MDVSNSDKEIVSIVISHLLEAVGPDHGRLFRSLAECRWSAPTLQVAVTTPFALDRLRNRFGEELRKALLHVVPTGELSFVVDAAAVPLTEAVAAPTVTLSSSSSNSSSSSPLWRPAKRQFRTFGEFVVGDGNKVVHAAASAVLGPGGASPLVIYGPTGSGKSHLLESIWFQAKQISGLRRIVHLSAEQFLNQFVEALQGAGLPSFRRKYRDLQLLLIDDLHHLANKRHTVVELQHTIDTLTQAGQRIVITCDRSPREIPGLGEELVGRLSAGLMLGMESPDEATREEILRRLSQLKNLELPSHMLQWLAADLPGDARVLAGAVNRLQAAAQAWGSAPNEDAVRDLLGDLWRSTGKGVRLEEIAAAVCEEFDLTQETLQSDDRSKSASQPRMLAMYLARRFTRMPLGEISRFFGRKSHSTVLSAESKVEHWLDAKSDVLGPRGKMAVDDALRRVRLRLRHA
jgi:chromosomal replication initiator protein